MKLGGIYIGVRAKTDQYKRDLANAKTMTEKGAVSIQHAINSINFKAVGIAAAAFSTVVAYQMTKLIKSSAMAAANYETLGVVMEQIGKNAGISKQEVDGFAESIRQTGIDMAASRTTVIKLMQAHIDLKHATRLGAIAQDAAVIGQINSSDALERLVYGIQTAQIEVLKTIGITVNFENAYKKLAGQLGITANKLTEEQKTQARLNVVMERGADIAGTYEAAMGTAGKKITSFTRYVRDFKVQMGQAFGSSMVILIDTATESMKEMQSQISKPEVQKSLENIALQFSKIAASLAADLPEKFDKIGKSLGTIVSIYDNLPAGLVGAGGLGVVGATLFGGSAGKLIFMVSLINNSLKTLDNDLGSMVEKYKASAASIQNVFDAMSGKRDWRTGELLMDDGVPAHKISDAEGYKGVVAHSIKNADGYKNAYKKLPPPPLQKTIPSPEDNSKELEALRKLAEKSKDIWGESFDIDYGFNEVQAGIDQMLTDKNNAIVNSKIESDNILRAIDDTYLDYQAVFTEEQLKLRKEFNQQYSELGMSKFDIERQQVERMMEIYREAGVEENRIAEMTSQRNLEISRAEQNAKIDIYKNAAGSVADTFRTIAQAGGEQSKKAFAMYKAFALVEAAMNVYQGVTKAFAQGGVLGFVTGAAVAAAGAVQIGMIANSKPPSYDQGGISNAGGVYQTGDIQEAHIPIPSGKIPVELGSGGKQQPVQIIMNNPVFQDLATQRQVMAQIATVIAAKVAPGAVIENYNNDGGIRQMVRGGA